MTVYWGVDSSRWHANKKVHYSGEEMTVFEYVKRRAGGREPSFWGTAGASKGTGYTGIGGGLRGGASIGNLAINDSFGIVSASNASLIIVNCIVSFGTGDVDVGNVKVTGSFHDANLDAVAPNIITTAIFTSTGASTNTSS